MFLRNNKFVEHLFHFIGAGSSVEEKHGKRSLKFQLKTAFSIHVILNVHGLSKNCLLRSGRYRVK